MEAFRMQAGFETVHVDYKGNSQVVADLLGGHIQAGFLATPSVLQLVREGKLKGLAVSASHRTPQAPEVPTVVEAGYPGFEIDFFAVMLAPTATPEEIRAMLQREVQRALESPDVKARLRAQDLEPIGSDGARLVIGSGQPQHGGELW
jgi:tripartite-type tricarboxylate transporter receptor subunit TctC